VVVRDLSRAAEQFVALGFNLTPRSYHTVPNPDGSLRPAGTANHCAMLQRGYLEIIAVTDPSAESFSLTEISGFVERFEGLHLLATGTDNASRVEAHLNSTDERPVSVRALHRRVDIPNGPRDAEFRLIIVPQLSGPDITFFFIEHKTPELLWTADSMSHPNGSLGLLELVIVADDLDEARGPYESALGEPVTLNSEALTFELDRSRLLVMTPDAGARHFGTALPKHELPHCAGQAVEVSDLVATSALLTANGVPFHKVGDRLTVWPDNAGGAFLQFAERAR
jgi:hypothetical protein